MQHESPSTREQIVQLLRSHGGTTAKALARELGITSIGVRRHLTLLERDALVRVEMRHQKMGRPSFVYSLTDQAHDLLPKNYHTLANQFLDATLETVGDQGVKALFNARMNHLLKQYRPRMEGKILAERVAELARIQEEAGYMAIWEQADNGYILKEQNCAIYRVACRHQQACEFEIELFRKLLDADITRVEHQIRGERNCTYRVRERRVQKPTTKSKRIKDKR